MRTRTFLLALATLAVQGLASLALAQEPVKGFNRRLDNSPCQLAVSAYPFTETGYPFRVDRLKRALATTGLSADFNADVVVFDNDFIGYRADGPDDTLRPTRNFPRLFFARKGQSFTPYYHVDTPPRGIENYTEINADVGHGTSIIGIILGGQYDDNSEPEEGDKALAKPNVRTLLVVGDASPGSGANPPKVWLRLYFVPVDYGDTEANSSDPIDKLDKFFKETGGAREIDVVNMSFGKPITDGRTLQLDAAVQGALVVVAAGNAKAQIPGENLTANPISADDRGIMLAVASLDPDGRLSHFSNFGESVSIAAPGCAIKSWIDGDTDAKPLSGTSMAAAVVTFAASLVRSRWDLRYGAGISLRNRLIASARLNPHLLAGGCPSIGQVDCVQNGNTLDIETAVLLNRDMIEYRHCAEPHEADRCPVRTLIGTLISSPASLRLCTAPSLLGTKPRYEQTGLTYNGAVKARGKGTFSVFHEPGAKVGVSEIVVKSCDLATSGGDAFSFRPAGLQLDGSAAPDEVLHVQVEDVVRIVTRAFD